MLTHEEMIGIQAEKGNHVITENFPNKESFVLYLMHCAAYYFARELTEGVDVLDLGCNTGYGTALISERAKHIIGVDISESAISEAKRAYPNLDFQLTDGIALPFENHHFDVVTSFQVIEHLVDPSLFITEVKRVLKPGGRVLFTTPNASIRLSPGSPPWNEFHVREYSATELEAFLRRHFDDVSIKGMFASQALYDLEVGRVSLARNEADYATASPWAKLGLRISKFAGRVAQIPRKLLGKHRIPTLEELTTEFSASDFCYSDSSLDKSLDLLAVCSDRT